MDRYILCGPGCRQQLGVLDRFGQGRCPVSRRHAERRDPVVTHGHPAAQHSEARGDLSYSSSGTRKPSSLLKLDRALGQGLSWKDVLHAGRVGGSQVGLRIEQEATSLLASSQATQRRSPSIWSTAIGSVGCVAARSMRTVHSALDQLLIRTLQATLNRAGRSMSVGAGPILPSRS